MEKDERCLWYHHKKYHKVPPCSIRSFYVSCRFKNRQKVFSYDTNHFSISHKPLETLKGNPSRPRLGCCYKAVIRWACKSEALMLHVVSETICPKHHSKVNSAMPQCKYTWDTLSKVRFAIIRDTMTNCKFYFQHSPNLCSEHHTNSGYMTVKWWLFQYCCFLFSTY